MSNNNEEPNAFPNQANKLIIGLLSTAIIFSAGALLGVWKQSDLTIQRLNAIDAKHLRSIERLDIKYEDRSKRVVRNLDALTLAFGKHISGDNEHQLMIQRQHLGFENFMSMLKDAHVDIEDNKQHIELMKQGCCIK